MFTLCIPDKDTKVRKDLKFSSNGKRTVLGGLYEKRLGGLQTQSLFGENRLIS